MKTNLKRGAFFMMGLCMWLSPSESHAQMPAVVGASNYLGTQSGIQNVGVYTQKAVVSSISGDMTVQVWDGPDRGFGWHHDPTGNEGSLTLPGLATDPDVALTEDGLNALVVYEDGTDIKIQRYGFNGIAFVTVGTPTVISAGVCQHPNIDGGNHDDMVIVWAEQVGSNGQMRSRIYDYAANTLLPIVTLSTNFLGNDMLTPDVALYDKTIYYTYIVVDTGTHLFYQEEDFNDVYTNSSSLNNNINFVQNSVPGGAVSTPRIATKSFYGTPDPDAFAIVAGFTIPSASEEYIISYTQTAGVQAVNFLDNMFLCENDTPAITWNNCFEYVVAWNHNNATGCSNLPDENIMARLLDKDGYPTSTKYQWVNAYTSGIQKTVGLSGRYSSNSVTSVGYAHESQNLFMYKQVACGGSPYMREAGPETTELEYAVYPNPAQENLFVEAANITEINIYSISGQLVKHIKTNAVSQKTIDISDMESGIYMLEVNAKQGIKKQKISIQ